uniref:Coiled-coil domain containing 88C n=1 Tax=Xiphophorus couchianus TaxID=32473 RepID=A0A3B5M264_9TELE
MLEEQLAAARGRCDKLHTLEKDNLLLHAKIHDLEMEREGERRRLEELLEENLLLELGQKQSMNESAHLGWELEQLSKNHDGPSLVHELNEGVSSRVLKLEKENRELQASIERLKEENQLLQEQQLHTQELDRENQSLSNQTLGEELLKEKQNLEREMHALRADKDCQVRLPLRFSEQQHLSEAVKALQERAQSSSEARVREAEAKNRLLHQSVTDAGSRLASLEAQLKVVSEEAECLRERAGRCEEVQREAARLERSREALTREALRLRREAEEAQKELQRLAQQEAQNSLLSMENLELRRSMENLRSSSARLPTLQEELQEAQRETQEAQRSVEEAREKAQGERKRAERLELNLLALNQEKQQLQEQLERSREEKLEADGRARENRRREEELSREVEDLKQERRRREEAEEERRKLQLDLEQGERSRKQLEKENLRVRTLQEAKELELEETASLASASLKEAATLRRELERLEEASAKAKELERENKELQKEATIDKKTLDTLREELVSEKLKAQQQNLELERLDKELERIGLSREKLLQQDVPSLLLSSNRSPNLNVRRTLKEEIGGLERKLEESNALNESLRRQLTAVGPHKVLTRIRCSQHASVRGAAPELLRFQDHLIAVEKSNASLQTESSLLKEQLKQLEGQNSSLNSQMAALQRHASTLQEHNAGLHTQTAKLQVDISAVSSQSASLMAQNAVLQGQVGALEAEAESWQRQRDEAWRARESALADHERLLSVHERQAHEYEQLIGQHAVLKGQQRALEGEHRALCFCRYQALLQLKDRWEEQQEAQQLNVSPRLPRLTQNQTQHAEQNQNLQQRLNELKNSLSLAQQEVSQWTARYDSLVDQNQNLDLSMTKLDNHCELLSRLKGNLEEENHHLLSQIHLLGQQNQTLLERSLESKEQFHQEHKLYIDKLNALRRQKEKLEEKIMDQYKVLVQPGSDVGSVCFRRSQWSGARALVKLIKPRKENGRDQNREDESSLGTRKCDTKAKPAEHTRSRKEIRWRMRPCLLQLAH